MFSGTVPPNLGNLQNLRDLILGSNQLEGTEMDGLNFVTTLTNCSKLEVLQIDNNNFQRMLPHSIANFSTSLWVLTINQNYISGSMPSSIGNLANLKILDLSSNFLTGSVPHSIGNLGGFAFLESGSQQTIRRDSCDHRQPYSVEQGILWLQ